MWVPVHKLLVMLTGLTSFCDGDRSQQSGNYDVQITYIGSCGKNGNYSEQMGFVQTRMSKTNRTYACLSGIFALPYRLSDDMQETWELFVKGSTGGWKRFITFNNKKACSDKRRLYPKWFKMLNIKDVPCPIPRGNYTVDCDRAAGWKFSQAKTLTYGEYKAIVNFYHNKENIGCTDFRANIVPMADEIQ